MNFFYVSISCLGSLMLLVWSYTTINSLYAKSKFALTSKFKLLDQMVSIFLNLKNNYIGDLIYGIVFIVIALLIYYLLTYKKYKNMLLLAESVEIMAKGNLDKRIEVKSKGEVKEVANNINKIVEQLKNITTEERKAQQTKTDLITNVSHDLRTPLTSIIGYLSLIEEDKYKDEVELRYYTNIAYEKAQNLKELINDLFELTKMQNHTLKFDKAEINLIELISQIMYHLEYQFKDADMEYRLGFCSEDVIINADPLKLVRAFENLIINAIKYGQDGRYIDIKIKRNKNMAIVQIINYGEQIPVVDLPHIFDRFYRVEKSRNRNDGGSGLGLAITKNIIESHNGSIVATSDKDNTVFEVKIPLKI